ncbi:hypothetical protein CLOM_g14860 [Closterium sp. NIES-68]|nr:hypothetical protein CLOM_g14860 [Closterium sp. NIES-68]GJP62009.1 hypothetical protein CLOP_g19115 [Closterium sp. NIES-67]
MRSKGQRTTAQTWHKRLGHPSQEALNNSIKASLFDKDAPLLTNGQGLRPSNRQLPCTICPDAHLRHAPFPSHFSSATTYSPMDVVFSDILLMPQEAEDIRGNDSRYIITFIDGATR